MNQKTRALRERAIQAAMGDLIQDSRFGRFIDIVRDQREAIIEDFCSDRVSASPEMREVYRGELRAYQAIISTYDDFINRAARDESATGDS